MTNDVKMALKELRHHRKECRHEMHREVSRLEREVNKIKATYGAKIIEFSGEIKRLEDGGQLAPADAPTKMRPAPDIPADQLRRAGFTVTPAHG